MDKPQVIVLGSINMDLTVKVSRLPEQGETLVGQYFMTNGGGKGANQAVALSRLGVKTALVGRVGNDHYAQQLIDSLAHSDVITEYIGIEEQESTGIATITVAENGANQIVIVAGANGRIDDRDLVILEKLLVDASFLLLQLEIPLPIVYQAIAIANRLNVPVILDPAPAHQLSEEIYPALEIITPNQVEASQLVGFNLETQSEIEQAASILSAKGVPTVIITCGEHGVFCLTKNRQSWLPALEVNAVDTVAAGDAFNAGLTAALVKGCSLEEAIRWGIANASLAITKVGAQDSLPYLDELEAMLGNL